MSSLKPGDWIKSLIDLYNTKGQRALTKGNCYLVRRFEIGNKSDWPVVVGDDGWQWALDPKEFVKDQDVDTKATPKIDCPTCKKFEPEKHKCRCLMGDLMAYGCKCGGV